MKTKGLIFLFLLFCLSLAAWLIPGDMLYRTSDGEKIPFSNMINDTKRAKVIFIGEVHDIERHHRNELAVIQALHRAGVPLTVGMEMFRAESDNILVRWVDGSMPLNRFLPVYYDNWSEPWPLYRDIFEYLRKNRIPAIGLNIPDDIADAIAQNGFASLSERQRRQLPKGISCNVDPTYMEFIKKAYAGHSSKIDRKFLNFCEAQMVWDKTMAWHADEYLKKNPERTLVVLAGVGHAWKRGIPEQLAGLSRYPYKVLLPLVPDQIDPESITDKDADYVFLD